MRHDTPLASNQLKILVFIHSLAAGGAERVTARLASHWAQEGHQVSVVTLAAANTDFYPLPANVQRHSLQLAQPSRNTVQAIWGNLRRIWSLRQQLRAEKPDVAIAMMGSSNVLLGIAALGLNKVATIAAERIYPPRLPLGRAWEMLRRHVYGHMDAVVTQTKESAAWLRHNTRAKNIYIIPNAAPESTPDQQTRAAVTMHAEHQYTLLAAGRLCRQKGFDLLIRAFSTIAAANPQWHLVIAGEGPERQALQQLIAACGMTGQISLPGLQQDMGSRYRQADIFVLSSRFEGFPNVLLEAMSYSLPVVSFDCDTGPGDIIQHQHNGLLVAAEDITELATALQSLMQNPQLREQLGKQASRVTETFSPQRIFRQWQTVLQEVRK